VLDTARAPGEESNGRRSLAAGKRRTSKARSVAVYRRA